MFLKSCPPFKPSIHCPSKSKMENQASQPPPGYPSENPPPTGKKKMKCRPRTKAKGDKGFIEGCLWGLCCCWLCEVCFD